MKPHERQRRSWNWNSAISPSDSAADSNLVQVWPVFPIAAKVKAAAPDIRACQLGLVSSGALHVTAWVFSTLLAGALLRVDPPRSGVHSLELAASFAAAPATELVATTLIPAADPVQASLDGDVLVTQSPIDFEARQTLLNDRIISEFGIPTAVMPGPQAKPAVFETNPATPVASRRDSIPVSESPDISLSNVETPVRRMFEPQPQNLDSPVESPSQAPSRAQTGAQFDTPPSKSYSPPPIYPAKALQQGIAGRVVLRVRVDAEGRVTSVQVYRSSGNRSLDQSAADAVKIWRFEPAKQLGQAVSAEVAVPIRFVIEAAGR